MHSKARREKRSEFHLLRSLSPCKGIVEVLADEPAIPEVYHKVLPTVFRELWRHFRLCVVNIKQAYWQTKVLQCMYDVMHY